jgi:cholest-4-en-3-one 26-monooxygenase
VELTLAEQVPLDQVDLMDLKWFADGPPHALFARMRANEPVRWNALPDGSGFWSLTRHEHIAAVSRDTSTWSSWRAGIFLNPDQVLPLDVNRNLLLYKDPPEHTKYRLILQKAFTPHSVAILETAIRARVSRTIDAVIERGECDFVHDIAVPVPLGVLAELMGLPDADIPQLYSWTERIEESSRSPEPAAAGEAFMEIAAYLHEQIQIQTERGEEDTLVMRLRAAEVDGAKLDDPEILVFFGLLVFAGNDTTRNTAAGGMLALLEHPDQLAQLRADPAKIPAAVEEILRYTSVVNFFARTASTDTEIAGQPIAQDEKVVLWYTSASRDEAVFEDPDRFDIGRGASDHMAFGGGGRHFCLGAGLARLELRVLLEEVTRRIDGLERAGEVTRLPSAWANSLLTLPVRFVPGERVNGLTPRVVDSERGKR